MNATLADDSPTFPLSWQDPADAARTWQSDPIHFPRPLSPLFCTLWGPAFADGFNQAGRELLSPGFHLRLTFQNGYYYESVDPEDGDDARAGREATEAALDRAVAELMERWQGEWLPRLAATRARLQSAKPMDESPGALLAVLDEIEAIARDDWLIHFRIVLPVTVAMQRFDELYADLFEDGAGADGDGHALLVGQPAATTLAGLGLADLAGQRARRASRRWS